MKKNVIGLLAVLSCLTYYSCTRDESGRVTNPDYSSSLEFRAVMEDACTKTSISKDGTVYKILWEETDSISINGVIFRVIPDSKNPSKAILTKMRKVDADPVAPYSAYYPASLYDNSTKKAVLPSIQQYAGNGCVAMINPMYAHTDNSTTLQFSNLCGMLKFTIKGTETLGKIQIIDSSKALSGGFSVIDKSAVMDADARGGVVLDCGEGVQLNNDSGTVFYIAVPAGNYKDLSIKFSTVNYAKICNMKADADAVIERNKVYPFDGITPQFIPDYFRFIALTDNGADIKLVGSYESPKIELKYSVDGGKIWQEYLFEKYTTGSIIHIDKGEEVYFRANSGGNTTFGDSYYQDCWHFDITDKVDVAGNIMYLLNGFHPSSVFEDKNEYAFSHLFKEAPIVNAEELILPANKLIHNCYYHLFDDCSSLCSAPKLPANTLAEGCYSSMFKHCSSLKKTPELPAMELASSCYYSMFEGCSLITSTPELPAQKMASYCYQSMFNGCSSLSNVPELPAKELKYCCYLGMFADCSLLKKTPELPATKLASFCYAAMFSGCTSLTRAPKLSASKMEHSCYSSMFGGCESLMEAPELPALTLNSDCYCTMFYGCISLTKPPILPAAILKSHCYDAMFKNCIKLNKVTMLATDATAEGCLSNWLDNAGTDSSIQSRTVIVAPGMEENIKDRVPTTPEWNVVATSSASDTN